MAGTGPGAVATPPTRRLPRAAIVASVLATVFVCVHWTRLPPVIPAPFDPAADKPFAAPVTRAPTVPSVWANPSPPAAGAADTASDAKPWFAEQFAAMEGHPPHLHAASAVVLADGSMAGFWYGGSAEGARDVSIFTATQQAGRWTPDRPVVIREAVQAALGRYIRKLGNASVVRHADGRLWMFFVTVSVGGWAGSSLNLIESRDDGRTWSAPRRLVTSPFLNISTLVRTGPYRYADGAIGLPAYHEFIGKYAELIRLDPDGRIIAKTRLSTGRRALQPDVIVLDEARAVLLLRDGGPPPRHLLRASTDDGGRSWTTPVELAVPNPNAAIDALGLGGDRLLAAFNDDDDDRERLTLAVSDDRGLDWRPVAVLAGTQAGSPARADGGQQEYSYPWIMHGADGLFHVLFTWNREQIRHVAFNRAWLDRKIAAAAASTAASPGSTAPALPAALAVPTGTGVPAGSDGPGRRH